MAPDGSWLASGGRDGTVRIWDVATGQERAVLTGHTGEVEAVAVAPDGSWLASGSGDGTVRIWDVATGQERAVLTGHTGGWLRWRWRRMAAGWPPAAAGRDGADLGRGHRAGTGHPGQATPARWRRWRWRRMAAGWPPAARTGRCGSGMRPPGRNGAILTGHTGEVEAVAVAPDGSWLASGGGDGTVRIWDVATGQERAVLTGHTGGVMAVAVAPDGSWLASGGGDGTVRIWDVATGQRTGRS